VLWCQSCLVELGPVELPGIFVALPIQAMYGLLVGRNLGVSADSIFSIF